MFIRKSTGNLAVILMAIVLMFTALPLEVLAAEPWKPYSQYIPEETPVVKRHLRGAWVCTVGNIDWPSAETRKLESEEERIEKSKDELAAIIDKAVELKLNAVFFQVSPEGDAFYRSDIVPWSRYLTGTFGKDPGFDPLAFAIEEAHKRNLEIHAWFNPYRVSMDVKASTKESLNTEKSVYMEHPDWIRSSMSRYVVDPGIPEAREWVMDRVMEVVRNYDVDGVHFDDYFYYEKYEGELKDEDTFNKYNEGEFSSIGDWRRNNTYALVKELSSRVRSEKAWVKFGISPAGVWGNKIDGHIDGSNTNTSFTNFEKSFANTKKWVEEELLDYIAPQIYFSFGNSRVPYGELASWWSEVCRGKKIHLYIGQALYKVNDDPEGYFKGENAVQELASQLKFNMVKPGISGGIMFRMKNFSDTGKQEVVSMIQNNLWAAKALVPVMPWKEGRTPAAPSKGKLEVLPDGLKLSWTDNDADTAYFAVYCFNRGENMDVVSESSTARLIATVRKNGDGIQEFIDRDTDSPDNVFYAVTSLDRLHNESSGLGIGIKQSGDSDNSEKHEGPVKGSETPDKEEPVRRLNILDLILKLMKSGEIPFLWMRWF